MALWTVFLFPLDISLQLLKRIRAIKYFSLLRPYIILGLLSLSNLLQLQYSQRFALVCSLVLSVCPKHPLSSQLFLNGYYLLLSYECINSFFLVHTEYLHVHANIIICSYECIASFFLFFILFFSFIQNFCSSMLTS